MHPEDELPSLKSTIRLGVCMQDKAQDSTQGDQPWLYDVKFYPYTPPGLDPVFAMVGGAHVIVCRPVADSDKSTEILQWFRDEDEKANLNSLAWSRDLETGDPLLIAAGTVPKIIAFNVRTGKLVRTLTGHGAAINELAVSPKSPQILASGSEDYTIRIWHLHTKFQRQPCAVIYAGDGGHKAGLLTVAFHPAGDYLLSGGMDARVSLWAVPDLPNANTGSDKPDLQHFPHFTSTEVHSDFVDCLCFYGDLIISKSAQENRILVWRIKGFSSASETPDPEMHLPAHTTESPETRSAFGSGWQQLLTLDSPNCSAYYMRFGLFHAPSNHPILAIGNARQQVFFWDLQSLEQGITGPDERDFEGDGHSAKKRKGKGKARADVLRSSRGESVMPSASSMAQSSAGAGSPMPGSERGTTSLGTPFKHHKAHKCIDLPMPGLNASQCAWSTGGEWCVLVGSTGTVCLLQRWK